MSWLDQRSNTVEDMSALNRHNFELYVSVGTDIDKLPIIFRKKKTDLDIWCRKEYGFGFEDTYAWLLNVAAGQYADVIAAFAAEGHKTAMSTMNEVLLKTKTNNTMKVQIVSDMDENDD